LHLSYLFFVVFTATLGAPAGFEKFANCSAYGGTRGQEKLCPTTVMVGGSEAKKVKTVKGDVNSAGIWEKICRLVGNQRQ
jgi:hypothetical protein